MSDGWRVEPPMGKAIYKRSNSNTGKGGVSISKRSHGLGDTLPIRH